MTFAQKVRFGCATLALSALSLFAQAASQGPDNSRTSFSRVPPGRLAHLRHGVNLSEWFAQVFDPKGYTREHFQTHTTEQDMALIKSSGFDHVRLSINPQPMFRGGHADELPPEYLAFLDNAVNLILKHGLAVMIDVHPEGDFKAKLASDDNFVPQFVDFWRGLARHYANLDPEMVFFEILNEPEIHDRYRWQGIQAKVAAAIRDSAPGHTIIATGARWSADDELLFLEPLPDPNVIYAFHFYEPHVFTHQGATWAESYWHSVIGLAYPSNRKNAEKVAANVPEEINRLYVLRYGMEHWDRERIEMEVGQVAAWAKTHNVSVVCNEFGGYRKNTDPSARSTWINDVRTTLEQNGMGWTIWDYSGGFGVVTKKDGHTTVDEVTLKALGLR